MKGFYIVLKVKPTNIFYGKVFRYKKIKARIQVVNNQSFCLLNNIYSIVSSFTKISQGNLPDIAKSKQKING